jgi:transposase-like protein
MEATKKGKFGCSGVGSFRRNRKKALSRKDDYRTKYSKEDMEKAVRLVKEDNWSIIAVAKEAGVPSMTLGDRLRNYKNPM